MLDWYKTENFSAYSSVYMSRVWVTISYTDTESGYIYESQAPTLNLIEKLAYYLKVNFCEAPTSWDVAGHQRKVLLQDTWYIYTTLWTTEIYIHIL